jgi:hypothetical protein
LDKADIGPTRAEWHLLTQSGHSSRRVSARQNYENPADYEL